MSENWEEYLRAEIVANGLDPKVDGSWYKIGVTYSDPAARLFAFRMAVSLSKKNSDAWNGIGLLIEDSQEKEQAFRNAIKADGKFAEAWYNLGTVLIPTREKKRAFQKVLSLDKKFSRAYIELAKLAADPEEKIELINTGILFDPGNETLYQVLLQYTEDVPSKIEILRKAIEQCPPSEKLWETLAFLIPDEADQLQPFKKILGFNPENLRVWEQVIRRSVHDNDLREWVAEFAGDIKPDLKPGIIQGIKEILTTIAYHKLINELFAVKIEEEQSTIEEEKERTREDIEQDLTRRMNDLSFPTFVGRSWVNLAQILSDDEEKVVALEKGLGIDPSMVDGWTFLGFAYKDLGKKKLAFQRAVGINPQEIRAWKGVASILTNPAEINFCYQRVLEVEPNDPEAKEYLTKVGLLEQAGESSPDQMPELFIDVEMPTTEPGTPAISLESVAPKKDQQSTSRKPIDSSKLQVEELLDIIGQEKKVYFEELAKTLDTTVTNLRTFFQEQCDANAIIGEFALNQVSFNFDKDQLKFSMLGLERALSRERERAEMEAEEEEERKELEIIAKSVQEEETSSFDPYEARKEAKSYPYVSQRYNSKRGLSYIEGDPQLPLETGLSAVCPSCFKQVLQYEPFCRWCGEKIAQKVMIRSATGVALPDTDQYPKIKLETHGPVEYVEELKLAQYSAALLFETKRETVKELFNNLEIAVAGLIHYEKVKAKSMRKFYKKYGWEGDFPDFPEDDSNYWAFVLAMAVGKLDFIDGIGRYFESVKGVKVTRVDFIPTDELKIYDLRIKFLR